MFWVWLVVLAVTTHLIVVQLQVGMARSKYDVQAPATTGHEMFDRHYRVHANSTESVVIFFPLLAACAYTGAVTIAAVLGAVYLVGRIWYGISYVQDPEKRGRGMMVAFLAQVGLLLVSLYQLF